MISILSVRSYAGSTASSSISVVGNNIVGTWSSNLDLSTGSWGFYYSFTDATLANFNLKEVAGVALNQTITVAAVDLLGYTASHALYVQTYYGVSAPGIDGLQYTVGNIITLTSP